MKGTGTLPEMGPITVEPGGRFDKHDLKWKDGNLYMILPVGAAMDAFCQR